jgi:hypothetical protein
MLSVALDLLTSQPALARLLFAEFLPREQVVVERYREWGDRLLTVIHDAAAEDPAAAELPEPIARAALGGIASVLGEVALRDPARFPELAPELTAFLAATFETAAARLLAALDEAHRPDAGFAEQVEASLRAAFDLFASDPTLAALLTVDFLPGSEALPDRYHRLLWRLAARLRHAADERSLPAPSPLLARAAVGGLAIAVATEVGEGRANRLPELTDPLAAWVVSLHGTSAPAN